MELALGQATPAFEPPDPLRHGEFRHVYENVGHVNAPSNQVRVRVEGGPLEDYPGGITADGSGGIVITGYFNSFAKFLG